MNKKKESGSEPARSVLYIHMAPVSRTAEIDPVGSGAHCALRTADVLLHYIQWAGEERQADRDAAAKNGPFLGHLARANPTKILGLAAALLGPTGLQNLGSLEASVPNVCFPGMYLGRIATASQRPSCLSHVPNIWGDGPGSAQPSPLQISCWIRFRGNVTKMSLPTPLPGSPDNWKISGT